MKKIILLNLLFILSMPICKSQVWDNTNIKLTNPDVYPYGVNINTTYTSGWAREFSFSSNSNGKIFSFGAYATGNKLNYGYIGGNSSGSLAKDSPWMIFKSSGNVGIGNTTAYNKLQITGDMRIGNGGNYQDITIETGSVVGNYNGVFNVRPSTIPGSGTAYHLTHFKNSSHANGSTQHNIVVDGNVGIGTITPYNKLQITGDMRIGNGGNYQDITIETGSVVGNYNGVFNVRPSTIPGSGTAYHLTHFKNSSHANGSTQHNIVVDGNVGIGTTNPDMELTVNGKIHAKEIKIDLNIPAPDYVFKDNYVLNSLEDVERFIVENNHLPEIPSAKDFEQNGVMQAEMDMLLLKKIEELTLYTISQEKKLKKQAEKIQSLELLNKKLMDFESRLEDLENK